MEGKFVAAIESQQTGGNCVADVLRLRSGALVVIADECLCVYYKAADWDEGEGEPLMVEGAEGFQRDDDAPHYFVRGMATDEPDGPVSTDLITLHDGRVIGIDSETICLYPNGEAFGSDAGAADCPGDWLYPQN